MVLKAQDIVVLVKIQALSKAEWSYSSLASALSMSSSTIHEGLRTCTAARLFDNSKRRPILRNLLELLIHGVKYCFPAEVGKPVRGVPTSYAAPPLSSSFPAGSEPIPVWPFAKGSVRGISLLPLYPTVPAAALADPQFGELMALIDAIRQGRPRESKAAIRELTARMG